MATDPLLLAVIFGGATVGLIEVESADRLPAPEIATLIGAETECGIVSPADLPPCLTPVVTRAVVDLGRAALILARAPYRPSLPSAGDAPNSIRTVDPEWMLFDPRGASTVVRHTMDVPQYGDASHRSHSLTTVEAGYGTLRVNNGSADGHWTGSTVSWQRDGVSLAARLNEAASGLSIGLRERIAERYPVAAGITTTTEGALSGHLGGRAGPLSVGVSRSLAGAYSIRAGVSSRVGPVYGYSSADRGDVIRHRHGLQAFGAYISADLRDASLRRAELGYRVPVPLGPDVAVVWRPKLGDDRLGLRLRQRLPYRLGRLEVTGFRDGDVRALWRARGDDWQSTVRIQRDALGRPSAVVRGAYKVRHGVGWLPDFEIEPGGRWHADLGWSARLSLTLNFGPVGGAVEARHSVDGVEHVSTRHRSGQVVRFQEGDTWSTIPDPVRATSRPGRLHVINLDASELGYLEGSAKPGSTVKAVGCGETTAAFDGYWSLDCPVGEYEVQTSDRTITQTAEP